MRLVDLISGSDVRGTRGDLSVEISDVEYDSVRVAPGCLFCAIPGNNVDGHDYAPDAVARGAVALVVERFLEIDVPQVLVDSSRAVGGPLAAAVHGNPSAHMDVIGVTGTNGKTTTTHMIANILKAAGRRCEVLGTLSGARTTPEAPELQRRLAGWLAEGVDAVAMEVSSHALAMHRVDGTRFAVAAFTNLSRDHLDFHGSEQAYFEAKAMLFEPSLSSRAVVGVDSPHGRLLVDAARIPTAGVSIRDVDDVEVTMSSIRFKWRGLRVAMPIGARFNVCNALIAAEVAVALGIDPESVVEGLGAPLAVPGRFEMIEAGQPFDVVVDYAHTPDGLEMLLESARGVVGDSKVIVVFGCGGARDRSKRPLMGEIAARLADLAIVTADNSRDEPTESIIAEIVTGSRNVVGTARRAELTVEPDREDAIGMALAAASPGDVVLIAGKGHETTQVTGGSVIPFDDRQVARSWLGSHGWSSEAEMGGTA